MLAIGRALMSRPRLLLLDEPSLGLAPILVQQIFEIIREINGQGMTILLVEQNALQALERRQSRLRAPDGQGDAGRHRRRLGRKRGRAPCLPRGDLRAPDGARATSAPTPIRTTRSGRTLAGMHAEALARSDGQGG